jgi:arylsulfatase A-like enzyme
VLPPHLPEDMEDIPDAGRRMAHMEMHQHVVAQRAWAGAVQGYLAALTFADTMLGEVLDALDASPHREDTLIVFWTDHGWSLGEKFHWKKFALWEECTRVPLVIAGPGIQSAECSRPVSLVDLYPTLAQLVGADVPPRLEGASLVPQLRDPTKERPFPAVTTHGFRNHAVRDERYRYIRYADGSEELYDHDEDPNEWNNLVRHPRYAEQRARLAEWLPQVDTEPAPSGKGDCNGGEDE